MSGAVAGLLSALCMHLLTHANGDLSCCCPPSMQQLDMKCLACRAAFVLGCIAGGVYIGCSRALLCLRIDDPLDASAVHAGCSLVGLLGERECQWSIQQIRACPSSEPTILHPSAAPMHRPCIGV